MTRYEPALGNSVKEKLPFDRKKYQAEPQSGRWSYKPLVVGL